MSKRNFKEKKTNKKDVTHKPNLRNRIYNELVKYTTVQ